MRIGIDARMINQSGIGRYLRNLLIHLQRIDRENDYYIALLKEDFNSPVLARKNFHPVLADFKWYGLKEQLLFPPLLASLHLDVVHFPHFNVPIFYKGRFVVTIHDLIHQQFKTAYASSHNRLVFESKHWIYRKVFSYALARSKTIITVSDFVKSELVNQMGVKEGKVVVTKEAVEESFIQLANQASSAKIKQTLKKFSLTSPYLFYVGNAHPHKNLERLIKSFLWLKKTYPKLSLVLSGKENLFWRRLRARFPGDGIIYTGFVSDNELAALFKGAAAYICPSLSEGFGIPLLEAFACGCPVVASNRTSLPEVGGEAAAYFNPEDQADLENKIVWVLTDKTKVEKMRGLGFKRLKLFDWNKLAERTLSVYGASLKPPRPL